MDNIKMLNAPAQMSSDMAAFTVKDKGLVALSTVAGITMSYALWTDTAAMPGFQITFLAIILVGIARWYSGKKLCEWGKENIFRTLAMLLITLGFSLYEQPSLRLFLEFCLFGFTGYWFLSITGNRMDNQTESTILYDGIHGGLFYPFRYGFYFFKSLSAGICTGADKKKILEMLGGLTLILPVVAVILKLLGDSDLRFQSLVAGMFRGFSPDADVIFRLVVIFIFALYFYGLFFGGKLKIKEEKRTKFHEKQRRLQFMTRVSVLVAIGILSAVYVVYTALQLDTLLSVLQGKSPWVLTIYAYARKGFYELCQVVLINAGVLAFIGKFLKEEERGGSLRFMQTLLCTLTLALIAVALSKMGLYIGQYGLTPKRVMTSWLMVTMVIAFGFVIISYYKHIPLGQWLVRIVLVMTVLLSLVNVDALVVRYNLNAYETGAISELDMYFLYEQGDAAIQPALETCRHTENTYLKSKLTTFLNQQHLNKIDVYNSDVANYNIESILADKAIRQWSEKQSE